MSTASPTTKKLPYEQVGIWITMRLSIKSFADHRNYTPTDLSNGIGTSLQSVMRWKRGEIQPKLANCYRMAAWFPQPIEEVVRQCGHAVPTFADFYDMAMAELADSRSYITDAERSCFAEWLPVLLRDEWTQSFSPHVGEAHLAMCDMERTVRDRARSVVMHIIGWWNDPFRDHPLDRPQPLHLPTSANGFALAERA